MGYTESLLADGEQIARRDHQHWLALILDSRAAVGVWVVAVVLFAASILLFDSPGTDPNQESIRQILGWIVLVLVVVGLVIFAYRWLKWRTEDYIVTNRRIIKVTGIVNKRSADSSLEKINDLVLEENLIGRMLGYGDLDIITAADTAIDRFRMLRNAKEFKRVMLDEKHALETGDFYRPSPPIMATSPAAAEYAPPPPGGAPTPPASSAQAPTTAAPAPAPATAVSAPAPSSAASDSPSDPVEQAPSLGTVSSMETETGSLVSQPATELAADEADARRESVEAAAEDDDGSREVTRTLARLADLRDRGAITAEEYEAKKSELLGRL